MNCIYRSISKDKTGSLVAASENAMNAGRSVSSATTPDRGTRFLLKALAASLLAAFGGASYALPAGGVVAQGGASISNGAGSTTITQSSQNVAINWQSFSIGATEAVRFVQPNSNSVALNRVLGTDPSSILGSMAANGKVFLLNPNGILFGSGSQVNVGGLVASTLNMTDNDFMAGNYRFSGSSNAAVVNQGTISAPGGYVALLGANVGNDGTILARLGTVTLAAGSAMTLDVAGDGLLNVTVNQGAVNALAQNGGLIQADGGQVLLTAMAAGNLLQSAVNNTGAIQAQTIENRNGTIRLMGDMQVGTANVSGTLDASAPNGGNGGFIETSAAHVKIQDNVRITTAAASGQTGTWLIDPVDFVIQAGFDISGAALSAQLVDTSVTITTIAGPGAGNGDIFVNEAVTWNGALGISLAPTTLTLNALRDVIVNQAITATNGNVVACCGRDINVNQAITTTRGSVLLAAGRDVNIVRSVVNPLTAITVTDGNLMVCAGNDINLDLAAITLTRGSLIPAESLVGLGVPLGMTLSAGNDGSGPGAAKGTLVIAPGTPPITVTGPNAPASIFYNPASYAAPTNYLPQFTLSLGATLTQFMLVFPDGANKPFDGSTVATFTGLKGAPAGVSLAGAGTANFDTAAVGVNKTVSFTGFTLAGVNAANFAFASTCCGPIVQRTTANIIAALPVIPPIPPVLPPTVPLLPIALEEDFAPEEMMGPEGFIPVAAVLPTLMPRVQLAGLPPQLLSIAPVPVRPPAPVVVPPPAPVLQQAPVFVPPVRPARVDRY